MEWTRSGMKVIPASCKWPLSWNRKNTIGYELNTSTHDWIRTVHDQLQYDTVLAFVKSEDMAIQMKDIERWFLVVLFIMLYKVVLTFDAKDEILKCDHSNESYWAVLSCGT